MNNKAFKYGAFAALFLFAFILGLVLTLPMGMAKRVIESQTEALLGFKYDVTIDLQTFIIGIFGLTSKTSCIRVACYKIRIIFYSIGSGS